MQDQEKVFLVREVVRLLLKAIKMRKLYGGKHAYTATAIADLEGSLRGFVKRYNALRLEITREALVWENQKIYEEASRDANFAYQLYLAGARQLTILNDVTATELDQLLGVLAARADEDVAALLWECEFEHVEYVCLDELMEGWAAPENLSQDAQQKIQEMNAHADKIIAQLESRAPMLDGLEHELSDTAEELEEAEKIQLDAPGGAPDEEEETVEVPQEALDELKNAVLDATPEKNLLRLLEVVFDGLALDAAALGDMNARWALEEIPLVALRRANLNLLAQILERYRKEIGNLKEKTGWVSGAIMKTFERMWSPDRIDELVQLALSGNALGGPPAFARVLQTMAKSGVVAAVTAALKSPPAELRDALTKYLTENAARAPEELGRMLAPDVPADLAKSALFIASKSVKGAAAENLYELGKQHPGKVASDYAHFLWRTNTPKGRLKAFQDALQAADPAERVRAADTLAKAKDPQALEELARLIDEPSFVSRTAEERNAFIAALVAIGGAPAMECLKRQTERKAGLFNRGNTEEVRAAAAKALEELRRQAAAQRMGKAS